MEEVSTSNIKKKEIKHGGGGGGSCSGCGLYIECHGRVGGNVGVYLGGPK